MTPHWKIIGVALICTGSRSGLYETGHDVPAEAGGMAVQGIIFTMKPPSGVALACVRSSA